MIHKQQRGAASLLAATLIGFLVLVLTVGMTALMVGELRQSTDAENSVRSYYAAETGAEEAVAAIRQNLQSPLSDLSDLDQSCAETDKLGGSFALVDAGEGVKLTCRSIFTQGSAKDFLEVNQTAQFDLSSVPPPPDGQSYSLQFKWHEQGDTPSVPFVTQSLSEGSSQWRSPAAMEVTLAIYETDPSGQVVPNTIDLFEHVLAPTCTTNTPPVLCDDPSGVTSLNLLGPASVTKTRCRVSADYSCSLLLNNVVTNVGASAPGNTRHTVIRIRPLFVGGHYYLSLNDSTGSVNLQLLPLQNALIDITAKVGDSYRRLQETVPIRSGIIPALDTTIYGENSVCKDFDLFTVNGDLLSVRQQRCELNNSNFN